MKRIFIIVLCFTNLIAFSQSILVNNQSVNVSSDISFPYWLDSTSTLAIDSHVVSISVLEFNITPTVNGNSLVFNQAKTVTSQETVPSGKTWKVESVLLDPSFTQSNNSGTTTVVSGGGGSLRPVALSNESSNYYTFTDGMIYCDSLVEDGYNNWSVPSLEEITFVASGGGIVPGVRSTEKLWTRTNYDGAGSSFEILSFWNVISLSGGFGVQPVTGYSQYTSANQRKIRCVRHAAVTFSSGVGSSSSGGSGNVLSSGLTPIAISSESSNAMYFSDALLYCDSLVEGGFEDWIMPTIEEMTFIASGGCVIPDARTDNYIWSRSLTKAGSSENFVYKMKLNFGTSQSGSYYSTIKKEWIDQNPNLLTTKTRCVRRGAVTVSSSGGGSSSGGSSTPSTLGNGMPTMISNESVNQMRWPNCQLYCESLVEDGFDDWIVPTIDQLTYATSGGCVITGGRSDYWIWSRTPTFQSPGDLFTYRFSIAGSNSGDVQIESFGTNNAPSQSSHPHFPKCRCVR